MEKSHLWGLSLYLCFTFIGCTRASNLSDQKPASESVTRPITSYLPDDIDMIGGLNVRGVLQSKVFLDRKAELEKHFEKTLGKERGYQHMKECGYSWEQFEALSVAVKPAVGKNGTVDLEDAMDVAVVFAGEHIGDTSKVQCLAKKQGQTIAFKKEGGVEVATLNGEQNEKAQLYIINKNHIAIATQSLSGEVWKKIQSKDKASGQLESLLTRTDPTHTLWYAGRIPKRASQGTPAKDAQLSWGFVDFAQGFKLDLRAEFIDDASALSVLNNAKRAFAQTKGMALVMGIEEDVLNAIKIEGQNKEVQIAAQLSEPQLQKLTQDLDRISKNFAK